jgi:hypothetical protein
MSLLGDAFVFMVTHDRAVFHGEFRTARAVGPAIYEIADEDDIVVMSPLCLLGG